MFFPTTRCEGSWYQVLSHSRRSVSAARPLNGEEYHNRSTGRMYRSVTKSQVDRSPRNPMLAAPGSCARSQKRKQICGQRYRLEPEIEFRALSDGAKMRCRCLQKVGRVS